MPLESTTQTGPVTADGLHANAILESTPQPSAEFPLFGPPNAQEPDPNSIRFAHGLLVALPAAALVWIVLGGLLWLMLR